MYGKQKFDDWLVFDETKKNFWCVCEMNLNKINIDYANDDVHTMIISVLSRRLSLLSSWWMNEWMKMEIDFYSYNIIHCLCGLFITLFKHRMRIDNWSNKVIKFLFINHHDVVEYLNYVRSIDNQSENFFAFYILLLFFVVDDNL